VCKCTDKPAPVTWLGLDLAKNVFQLHGVNANGEVVLDAPKEKRRGHTWLGFDAVPPDYLRVLRRKRPGETPATIPLMAKTISLARQGPIPRSGSFVARTGSAPRPPLSSF
jgi:hypothetical protein